MPKILLVEDNCKYANAAKQYLASKNQSVALALDYSQAMNLLENPYFDGVISDCFFPETSGSGNISLGKELVQTMANSDPRERKIAGGLEILSRYVDLGDLDAKKYARFVASQYSPDSAIFMALESVATISKEAATHAFKETFRLTYREDRAPKDYYKALMNAMEKSEANQPLGLLIAEKASELGLPFILATSTYHHDVLTQPLQDYASRKGWKLMDCGPNREDDKASPAFWEEVLGMLENRLG